MSDYRESANRRRDARQTKLEIRPPAARRNTKAWCRGKVGRKHQPVCMDYADLKNASRFKGSAFKGWKVLVCKACDKHLDFYWPSPLAGVAPKPPAWVT